MAQGHMDRLSALDASFLTNETRRATCTSAGSDLRGAAPQLRGPPRTRPSAAAPGAALPPEARLSAAPTGRPFWVDDPHFNLAYHVRHSALPSPGSEEQLRNIAARLFSQGLDRTKPLWELWLVQGLDPEAVRVVTKTHHALVDGVSGVDIATVLFDVKPVPEPVEPDEQSGSRAPALGRAAGGPRTPRGWSETPIERCGGSSAPSSTARHAAEGRRGGRGARRGRLELHQPGAGGPAQRRDRLAPALRLVAGGARSSSSGSRTRSGARSTTSCSPWSAARCGAGCTARGVRTEGLELRALVPVSIRAEDEHGQLGNRIAAMRGPLPVYIEDPVKRLELVPARRWAASRSPSRRSAPR